MSERHERQLKKLTHKLNYLKEELAEFEESNARGQWELRLAVLEVFARAGMPIPTQKDSNTVESHQADSVDVKDDVPEEKEDSKDPSIKKIHRKIVLKTHPDKLVDYNDDEREALTQLYREATEAAKNGDKGKLIEIATMLDIALEVDDDYIAALEKRSKDIEVKINELRVTPACIWMSKKDDDSARERMLSSVIQNMGIPASSNHIKDVLEWVKLGCPGGSLYSSPDKPRRTPPVQRRRPGTRPEKIQRNT
jgi:hypothetical protein